MARRQHPVQDATALQVRVRWRCACIHASSNAAWSFWVAPVPSAFSPIGQRYPWRWFIPAAIPDADPSAIGKDDAPARGGRSKVTAATDAAERATMSPHERWAAWSCLYAAIQYIWDAKTGTRNHPAQFQQHEPHQEAGRQARARRPGRTGSRSAVMFGLISARLPGEEPGEIEGVGLMTDTDSLGGKRLRPATPTMSPR